METTFNYLSKEAYEKLAAAPVVVKNIVLDDDYGYIDSTHQEILDSMWVEFSAWDEDALHIAYEARWSNKHQLFHTLAKAYREDKKVLLSRIHHLTDVYTDAARAVMDAAE